LKIKYNILIVEDEPLIADDIAFILEDGGYNVVGKALDTREALQYIDKASVDMVLLDISLDDDDEDGIDLAHIINEKYALPFIFITSHTDKLTINRVKKTNPCGFITKPFNAPDILSILSIALYKRHKNLSNNSNNTSESFFVKQGHDLIKIKHEDILFLKADDNYTSIVLYDDKILASLNLKTLSEKLPRKYFVRIHRSYVVNISKIIRISHRFVYIDKHEIPLGRGYYATLQELITML